MNTPASMRRARLFGSKRAWPVAVLFFVLILAALPAKAGLIAKELSPNLVPQRPWGIYLAAADGHTTVPPYALRFSVTIGNHGKVPLDFKAKESEEDPNLLLAVQCTRWIARHVCAKRESTGEYVYHDAPDHQHFHITDFAQYELRSLTEENKPDMSPQGLVAGGQKVSFCVQDTGPDNPKLYHHPNPIYTLCGDDGHQGISPGWSDTYGGGLTGQQIVIEDIPDGIYALVVTIDPTERFFERPREDNVSFTRVEITEGGTVAYEV